MVFQPYAEGGCLAERMHSFEHGALTDTGISSLIPQLVGVVCFSSPRSHSLISIILGPQVLGVAEMHASGVCNRDIKPDSQCGTPGYVAPEVYQDRSHGYAADIFSMGCIIYKLICGEVRR